MTELLRDDLETLRDSWKNTNRSRHGLHEQEIREPFKENKHLTWQTNDILL